MLIHLSGWISIVHAEGSRDLVKYGGYRPYLEFIDQETAGIKRQPSIKVFVKAGEQVNVGSSVPKSANNNADIVYRWPPGNPPLLADGQVGEGSFDVDSKKCGFIKDVPSESAGPLPNPGGYTPCTFIAQTTGIYEIEFRAPEFTGKTKYPVVKKVKEDFPTNNQQHQAVAAWDVTVFKTPNDPSTEQTGRAYATFLPMDMGKNDLSLNARVFFLNKSGYLYRVNLNGIDPYLFIFFANSKGFQDKADETSKSIYNSVEIAQIDNGKVFLHDPNEPDEQTDITHKIFFNPPAADLPLDIEVALPDGNTTWLRSTLPALPKINDFKFIGDEGSVGQTGTLPLKGHFSFTVDMKGDYIITIDANNNLTFGDEGDVVMIGPATAGEENIIPWNGLDGLGNPLPAQTMTYNSMLTLIIGAMHFPFLDPENNPDGLIVNRVNCDQLPCIVENSTVFYNNSGLNLKDKQHLNAIPPKPISATAGVDSSNGAQKFSNRFGDLRGIDTWTSLATDPIFLKGGLELKQADISVSKTHDSSVLLTPGGPITYLITVHNAGPSHIEGIQVQDSLPPTITDPFWTCKVTPSPSAVVPPAIQNRCEASGVNGPLNTTVDLQQGATATFIVEATISSTVAEGATIDNSVTITRPKDVTNPFGEQLDVKTETATHSVTLAPPTNKPPVAQDKNTATRNDTPVQIPALSAQDSDGSVVSYTVFQLPPTNQGKLYLGDPAAGSTLITEGQKLTPAQISNLYFKPDLGFGGEVIFNYQAVDDQGSASNTAKVTITVTVPPANQPPVADDKLAPPIPNDMTVRLPALSGSDDGEIVSYTITTLPPSNQGTLYLVDPVKGKQPISIGFKLIPNEVASIFFEPKPSSSGQVTFNYLVTDNQGANSAPATVTIPVIGPNQPPVADDKTTPAIPNNTTIALPALTATDKDGTIESYKIMTIPPESQGKVYLDGGKPIFAGQLLTPEEVKILFFQPANNFGGGEVKFTYTATDNYAAVSNTATVTIPVLAPPNQPPIANDDSASTNPNTPVTIPILTNDSDPDGDLNPKISITSQPPNGTVVINSDGTVTYTPNPGFANNTDTFTYQVCDLATPPQCDTATVTVTVTIPPQLPPIAENLTAPTTLNNTVVQLPPLVATDSDGTVTTYTIETLPVVSQGILYLGHPAKDGNRVVNIGDQLTPAEIEQLFFQPDGNFTGKASFIYSATDNLGAISNQALVTIPVIAPVNLPPLANDDTDSTNPNTPVTIAILNNDNDPEQELNPSSIKIISSPPNGKVVVNPDGTVTYTPNPDFTTGIDVFEYEVCDAGIPPQCARAKVTVSVPKPTNQPPLAENKITPPSPNNVMLPVPSLFATDSDGTVVSYTIATLPSLTQGVLYLSVGEGFAPLLLGTVLTPEQVKHLYFRPKSEFTGNASFTYTATDNQGAVSNQALVTMPIIAAVINQPPIANDDSAVTNPDTPVIIPILKDDSDPEGNLDTGSIEIVTLPANGKVEINADGTVTYTPNPGFTTGIDTFVYEVCDMGSPIECDTATVKVTVPVVDPPPIADNKVAPTTTNNQPVSLPPLTATDNGTVVSYTITTLPPANQGILYLGNPTGGSLVTPGQNLTPAQVGQLFFQPNSEFIGNASFTYTATDNVGGISSPALVTMPVTSPPNSRPVANDDSAITEPDTPVTISILNNDKDPESNLDPSSVTITKQPTQGTIKVNPDGTITYTPKPGAANIVDTLTYQVCDKAKPPQCDTAKVTITIPGAENNPPIANDESTVTDPETPVKINILNNDSDPEDQLDPRSVTINTQAQHGQVVVNPDGSVTYTPNPGFTVGIDTFIYQVCDKGTPVQCDQATVSIMVPIPANLPPVADNKAAATITNDASVQLPPLSATDVDGSVVSYTVATLPPQGQGTLYLGDPKASGIPVTVGQVLTPAQASQLFFQPNPSFTGKASFTYAATDNLGATSSPALVTIPVKAGEQPVDLSVTISGNGTVTSEPPGVNCNNSNQPCNHTYDYGTNVTLTPTADPGWEFEGWRGHCDNNDQVDMDGFKQCKAIFVDSGIPQFPLNIEKPEGGTVKTQPTGIDCGKKGDDCNEAYASGSMVDLIAEPEPGYSFVEWSGDCHGTSPTITVMIGQELNCKAVFSRDGDEDGIASEIEDGAPNNGDGNNDGIPDSQQNNVVSLLTPEGKYITIEERNGCTINGVKINQDSLPKDGTYYSPALIDYLLSSCPEADIKVYYHDVSDLGDQPLRQYAATTPGDPNTMQWQDQANVTRGTVLIDGKPVVFETFKLKDGELGDNTGVDGQILHTSGRVIEPGQIQLSSTNYTIDEFGHTATVTVRRTGSCDGIVTVDYTTQAVTATVNTDYTPISGKITWADGDCSDKVISIPIIDDKNQESNETIAIKLLNATGGATVATQESTLTIIDDDLNSTTTPTTTCGTSSCTSCGTSTCTNGCSTCQSGCSTCQPASSLQVKTLSTTIKVGETVTMTIGEGKGDLLIKEMPYKAFVSLESWKPLSTGVNELSLKGLSVGDTKMVISDSATPPQTTTIYITVVNGNLFNSGNTGTSNGFSIQNLQTTLEVGQNLDMTVAGGYGELSISEIPDPHLALLEAWTPLGNSGTATFNLIGVSPGRTKLVLTDQTSPPQKITVYITVVNDRSQSMTTNGSCEPAIGMDSQGNPINSPACFKGQIYLNEKLQSNQRRLSHQEAQQIKVLATVQVDPAHIGQAADILTVGIRNTILNETKYTRDDQTWQSWDGQISSLPVAQYYPQLPETIEVFLYEGDLSGMPGEYHGYVGYRLKNGTLIYNGIEPIHFLVSNSASIDMRGEPRKEPASTDAYTTSFFESLVHNGSGKVGDQMTFDNEDELIVSTFVQVEPQDVGQPADILMVAVHNTGLYQFEYTRTGPNWLGWDSQLESLSAAQHYHQLPALLEIPIYLGSLSHVPGEFTGYVGYRTPEGLIVFNGFMPVRLTIANGAGLTAPGNKFPTTARFISWGYHDNHLGNPFDSATDQSLSLDTTIWVDPQHQGQVADIQIIGLCCQWSEQRQIWGQWSEQQISFQKTIPNMMLLPKLEKIHLDEKRLSPGEYTVYISYHLNNGDIIYNGAEPLRLKIW
ncbi:MAG: tandem-95 repeat protein [Thioploca sp.]|nr:tandem-95 repeat protein [Thioploca sp.]